MYKETMLEFWERVKKLLTDDLNQSWLSREIGVSHTTMSAWINRNRLPKADMAVKIADALGVTVKYLLTGEESSLDDDQEQDNPIASSSITILNGKGVPFYNITATAHIAEVLDSNDILPEYFVDYKPFNDCTAYIPVYGDSMYPKFSSGDVIALKQMNNLSVIPWGDAYVVVTNGNANNLCTLKLVFPGRNEDEIILRASNPNFAGDMPIKKKDIIGIFIVKGKIRQVQM